jgi:hypothetical protein
MLASHDSRTFIEAKDIVVMKRLAKLFLSIDVQKSSSQKSSQKSTPKSSQKGWTSLPSQYFGVDSAAYSGQIGQGWSGMSGNDFIRGELLASSSAQVELMSPSQVGGQSGGHSGGQVGGQSGGQGCPIMSPSQVGGQGVFDAEFSSLAGINEQEGGGGLAMISRGALFELMGSSWESRLSEDAVQSLRFIVEANLLLFFTFLKSIHKSTTRKRGDKVTASSIRHAISKTTCIIPV